MNQFQLQCISDSDLEQLFRDAKKELDLRAKSKKVSNRLARISVKSQPNELDSGNLIHGLLRPPHLSRRKIGANMKYFSSLLAQDWSSIYGEKTGDKIYYVYAHVDPGKAVAMLPKNYGGSMGGTPFYIGKGCGDRAYNLKRNQGHGKNIASVLSDGYSPESIVKILISNLTESEAFEIESKLIFFFGTVYEKSRKFGCLYNLDLPRIPDFDGVMPEVETKRSAENNHC